MASMAPTSLFCVPADLGIPEFVGKDFDPSKYLCVKCGHVLLPPVMQFMCGHRICRDTCLEDLKHSLVDSHCPGDEEDCKEVDANEPGQVYPDVSATKELSKALVFCYNKVNGCPEQMTWIALIHDHIGTCTHIPVECKFKINGCLEKITPSQKENHEDACVYGYTECPYCQRKDILKIDMQKGHAEQCALQQKQCPVAKIGCPYVGSSRHDLVSHVSENVPTHLSLIKDFCGATDEHFHEISAKIFEVKEQHTIVLAKIIDIRESDKELKSKIEPKLRNTQRIVAKNTESIEEMKQHEEQFLQLQQLQEDKKTIENRMSHLEQGLGGTGVPAEFITMTQSKESSIAGHDRKIADFDMKFQCLEATCYDGFFIWKVTNYSHHKQKAVTNEVLSLYSQPFYTSTFGYKMCLRLYPNGDGMGKSTHMSLYLVLMKGDFDALLTWPFRQRVSFTLMDLDTHRRSVTDTFRPDPTSGSFQRPVGEMNIASGFPLFIQQSKLDDSTSPYVKDNTIFIKAVVEA